jgi:ADP-heptose:LPS heptosyltransferase
MKLLVISLAGIGDTLFATPLIHELRAHFPEATIDALVLWRGARELLENNPHLNHVHQCNLIAESRTRALNFLLGLRREGYDYSFNTYPQSRLAYRGVARLIGARTRISHHYHNAWWIDRLCVQRLQPQDYSQHAITNNLALLNQVGLQPKLLSHGYELFLTPAEQAWAADYTRGNACKGGRLLGIHVGSGGTKNLALRRWPLASYGQLIRNMLAARPATTVLLFGGPEEQHDHAQLQREMDDPRVLFPPTQNLRQAAALLGHCHAFLSVDTALMHLAAAMRVPGQVVIETPTWNRPIEPYGNPFVLVPNLKVAGRNLEFYRYDGYGIRGKDDQILEAMRAVSVEAVLKAVLDVWDGVNCRPGLSESRPGILPA